MTTSGDVGRYAAEATFLADHQKCALAQGKPTLTIARA